MLRILSRFFSIAFHPILIPLFGLNLLFNSGLYIAFPSELKRAIYLIIFLGTILIPILIISLLYSLKLIKSIYLEKREERILPLLIVAILCFLIYYWIKDYYYTITIQSFILSISFITVLLLIISIFWKISLHMAGIGGLTGLIFSLSFHLEINFLVPIIVTILISGILGTSRLLMEAHKPSQIYTGYFLGLFIVLILTKF